MAGYVAPGFRVGPVEPSWRVTPSNGVRGRQKLLPVAAPRGYRGITNCLISQGATVVDSCRRVVFSTAHLSAQLPPPPGTIMDTAGTGEIPAYGKSSPRRRALGVEGAFLLVDPSTGQPVPVAERALDDAAAQSPGARAAARGTSPVQTIPTPVRQPRYPTMAGRFGLTVREQLTCGYRVWLPVLLGLSATRKNRFGTASYATPSGPANDVRGFTT